MLPLLTAEQFLEGRFELPEAGQWSELVLGAVELLEPPDVDHGTAVLNLSKALAEYVQQAPAGYACFDLGLQLAFRPDTVRFPAACYFSTGPRFAETDKPYTSTIPAVVVELASTSDRRRAMARRVQEYLEAGAAAVWILDPRARSLAVHRRGAPSRELLGDEVFEGAPELSGFQVKVKQLFAAPDWWSSGPPANRTE